MRFMNAPITARKDSNLVGVKPPDRDKEGVE